MDQTIHYGIEAASTLRMNNNFEFIINGSLSRNYINKGYYFLETGTSTLPDKIDLSGNRISGFPNFMMNAVIKYHNDNFLLQANLKYVGDFFTDNYDTKLTNMLKSFPTLADYSDNRVDSYFVTNLFISYNLNLEPSAKNVQLFFQVNNLFDNLYEAYGIGKEYFPAAERNFVFGIKLGM